MTDRTIELDSHRGMAAQKATELRRLLSEVAAGPGAAQGAPGRAGEGARRRSRLETWADAVEKARYLLSLFAATAEAEDPRRKTLIETPPGGFRAAARGDGHAAGADGTSKTLKRPRNGDRTACRTHYRRSTNMARFEMTTSNGEKILVDHVSASMQEIVAELGDHDFVLFNEIKGGSSTPARELIVATSQITLIRSVGDRHPEQRFPLQAGRLMRMDLRQDATGAPSFGVSREAYSLLKRLQARGTAAATFNDALAAELVQRGYALIGDAGLAPTPEGRAALSELTPPPL